MENSQSRWGKTVSCMKSPAFLLTLCLINLVLVLGAFGAMHRMFRFERNSAFEGGRSGMMYQQQRGNREIIVPQAMTRGQFIRPGVQQQAPEAVNASGDIATGNVKAK
ncbi:MAG: hypothetical protein WCJ81_01220 [bacterium]